MKENLPSEWEEVLGGRSRQVRAFTTVTLFAAIRCQGGSRIGSSGWLGGFLFWYASMFCACCLRFRYSTLQAIRQKILPIPILSYSQWRTKPHWFFPQLQSLPMFNHLRFCA